MKAQRGLTVKNMDSMIKTEARMTTANSTNSRPIYTSGVLSNKHSQLKQHCLLAGHDIIPQNIIRDSEKKKLNNKLSGASSPQNILLTSLKDPKINSLDSKETTNPNSYRQDELYLAENKYKSGANIQGGFYKNNQEFLCNDSSKLPTNLASPAFK